MGTNYYVTVETTDPCPTCGHAPRQERLHIGKSAMGWKFLFMAHPKKGLTSKTEWLAFLADKTIVDEYGREKTYQEFVLFVTNKQAEPCGVGIEPVPIDVARLMAFWKTEPLPALRVPMPETRTQKASYPTEDYVDPEGFRFSTREFS